MSWVGPHAMRPRNHTPGGDEFSPKSTNLAGPSLIVSKCVVGGSFLWLRHKEYLAVLVAGPQDRHMACGAVTPPYVPRNPRAPFSELHSMATPQRVRRRLHSHGGHRRGRGPRQPGTVPLTFLAPTVAARLLGHANVRGYKGLDKTFNVSAAGCDCRAGPGPEPGPPGGSWGRPVARARRGPRNCGYTAPKPVARAR
eukprot:gene23115-biopygen1235